MQNKKETCSGCEDYNIQVMTLKRKIENVTKENIKLLDTISPCPLPDENMIRELQEKTM